ncbi:MAG: hypothetical protein Q7J14_00685 [Candidatus Magasanikbacteria bacterium]|nr:hypothetical protein [Candidatus Magasanikbacteria bacterium]
MEIRIFCTEQKISLMCKHCQKETMHLRVEEDPRTGRIIWMCSGCKKKKSTNEQGFAKENEEVLPEEDEEKDDGI